LESQSSEVMPLRLPHMALANRQNAFSLKPKSDCPLPGNEKPGAISSDKTIRTDCAPGWQSARRKKQHFFESYRDE